MYMYNYILSYFKININDFWNLSNSWTLSFSHIMLMSHVTLRYYRTCSLSLVISLQNLAPIIYYPYFLVLFNPVLLLDHVWP